ncbi:MAG: hypothetical protein RSD90_00535 [Anaerovoracaceae bacterium]
MNNATKDTEEFDDVKKEVNRVQTIKMVITSVAMIIVLALTIMFWENADVYAIQLDADKNAGYQWTYTLSEKGIVEETLNYYANGVFSFEFKGLKRGEVEIRMVCLKDGDTTKPVKKETYMVRVDKGLKIATMAYFQ